VNLRRLNYIKPIIKINDIDMTPDAVAEKAINLIVRDYNFSGFTISDAISLRKEIEEYLNHNCWIGAYAVNYDGDYNLYHIQWYSKYAKTRHTYTMNIT